ncbi:MAG: hypothetical protein ACRC4L_03370, partial [Mycoplasma sp.]
MSFIKKVFKSTFGIAGVALSVAGLGLTVAGAVMVPTSANAKTEIMYINGVKGQMGVGTSNWFVRYINGDKYVSNMETAEWVKVTSNKQIKDFHKSIMENIYEVNSPKKIFEERLKYSEKIIITIEKQIEDEKDEDEKTQLIERWNSISEEIKQDKEIISRFDINVWGIVLVAVGPAALLSGVG